MDALTVAAESPLDGDLDLLFARHHAHCHADTPPESIHMLDRSALVGEEFSFLVLRDRGRPVAMGALKQLGDGTVELKSMHVLQEARGTGASRRLLSALIDEARRRNAVAISLETGAQPSFAPARSLYARAGFRECPPFGNYRADPMSFYMRLDLQE
ncbi:GNAT family N-acetyltransferase [Paracoccus aurantiacus]|uniref:GNAT family N-acetyltransferase n=1 Tax=Paracoccus aurantiacus TaxID=2599412 RepID=A0A5C6S9C2_9RHOB|nr:GNAT family N-acetyltransferase [Paracoccus aurantiacus]TXB70974.1 GNAT family N-acetyltransferase [Paracoccus aurantiacus]